MTDFDELDELLAETIDVDVNAMKPPAQNFLTADLFSSMTDDDLLSHFMPIRGIDYDQNYLSDDSMSLKKEKDEEPTVMYMADEFLPYRLLPQINPVYHLNQELFKSVIPTNRAKDTIDVPVIAVIEEKQNLTQDAELIEDEISPKPEQIEPEEAAPSNQITEEFVVIQPEKNAPVQLNLTEAHPAVSKSVEPPPPAAKVTKKDANKTTEPRPIMKRKPRTYKYNPKPLQEKVNRAFVPDDLKDVEYWERRKRNNEAAKKSRKERRAKELEILNNFENMRREFQSVKDENKKLKARNAVLEKQVKELKAKHS